MRLKVPVFLDLSHAPAQANVGCAFFCVLRHVAASTLRISVFVVRASRLLRERPPVEAGACPLRKRSVRS